MRQGGGQGEGAGGRGGEVGKGRAKGERGCYHKLATPGGTSLFKGKQSTAASYCLGQALPQLSTDALLPAANERSTAGSCKIVTHCQPVVVGQLAVRKGAARGHRTKLPIDGAPPAAVHHHLAQASRCNDHSPCTRLCPCTLLMSQLKPPAAAGRSRRMSVKEVERHAVVRSMIGLKYGDGEPIDNLLIAEVREGCPQGRSAEVQWVGRKTYLQSARPYSRAFRV